MTLEFKLENTNIYQHFKLYFEPNLRNDSNSVQQWAKMMKDPVLVQIQHRLRMRKNVCVMSSVIMILLVGFRNLLEIHLKRFWHSKLITGIKATASRFHQIHFISCAGGPDTFKIKPISCGGGQVWKTLNVGHCFFNFGRFFSPIQGKTMAKAFDSLWG